MQKVADVNKVLEALPPKNASRFHQLNYEDGVRDALQWVLEQEPSREIRFYSKQAGVRTEAD